MSPANYLRGVHQTTDVWIILFSNNTLFYAIITPVTKADKVSSSSFLIRLRLATGVWTGLKVCGVVASSLGVITVGVAINSHGK